MSERSFILLAIALIVIVGITPIIMWSFWGNYMPGMMMGYRWWITPFILVIFLILVILGVYYITTEKNRYKSENIGNALKILKERYAKGEVTREQYLKMKEDLES